LRIIAHRGASAQAPENTLAAFERALALGVECMELDVRLTGDGVPVVIHDEDLRRTTDGKGRVAERALAEIRRLSAGEWFGARFREERVPTLEEVYRLVGGRAELNVEIKGKGDGSRETALAALEVARASSALGHTIFSSFEPKALQACRTRAPEARVALLVEPGGLVLSRGDPVEAVEEAVLARVAPWQELALEAVNFHRSLAFAPLVQALHASRWEVNVFTVDDPQEAEALEDRGVDGVFTNDPARFLERWPPRTEQPAR
jgi:glycerophosphoryl diester phosphodiesterase